MSDGLEIQTERLRLRSWRPDDRDAFATLNADPEVMEDLGGPISRAKSDLKYERFANAFEQHGYGRWVIENTDGLFLGYTGVMPNSGENHPLGPHYDVGWRLNRTAWGQGFAVEAARTALDDVFTRIGLSQVYAYTAPDNLKSQSVMHKLGLKRAPQLDYVQKVDEETGQSWHGLVWIARPEKG